MKIRWSLFFLLCKQFFLIFPLKLIYASNLDCATFVLCKRSVNIVDSNDSTQDYIPNGPATWDVLSPFPAGTSFETNLFGFLTVRQKEQESLLMS